MLVKLIQKKDDIKDHLERALRQAIEDINLNSMFGIELEVIEKLFITYH